MTSTMRCNSGMKDYMMTSAKEKKLLTLRRMKVLIGLIRPRTPKIKKNRCRIRPKDRKRIPVFWEKILLMKLIHKTLKKERNDIIVPEILQSDERNESFSPRGREI